MAEYDRASKEDSLCHLGNIRCTRIAHGCQNCYNCFSYLIRIFSHFQFQFTLYQAVIRVVQTFEASEPDYKNRTAYWCFKEFPKHWAQAHTVQLMEQVDL